MAGGFDLSSIFGGGSAAASGLGALSGLTSALGSGNLQGGSIGGGGDAASNAITDALGWSYGFGDQSGSTTAQIALGGDAGGPTSQGTAQQYMQGQQQAGTDTGQDIQDTPAKQSLQNLQAPSQQEAYGTQAFAPGARQPTGPTGWQVAQNTGQDQPAPSARSFASSPEQMSAAEQSLRRGLGIQGQTMPPARQDAPAFWQRETPWQGVSGAGGLADYAGTLGTPAAVGPTVAESELSTPTASGGRAVQSAGLESGGQSSVPLPQPRPAAADAAPAANAGVSRPSAAATPPGANDPAARAMAPPGGQQGAQQNPIQQIMQALGLQNLPPPLQQVAAQIIRQALAQLQGVMGGGMMGGQQGQGQMPPWLQGYGPGTAGGTQLRPEDRQRAQQALEQYRGGLAPGFSRDARGNLTRDGQPPDVMLPGGRPGWKDGVPRQAERSASESGAPTATGPDSPPGGWPARSGPDLRRTSPTVRKPAAQKSTAEMTPDQIRRRLRQVMSGKGRTLVAKAGPERFVTRETRRMDAPPEGLPPAGEQEWNNAQAIVNDPDTPPSQRKMFQDYIQRMIENPTWPGWGRLRQPGMLNERGTY